MIFFGSWKQRATGFVAFLLCLGACGADTVVPDQQATEVPAVQETFIQSRDLSGQKVYAEFCASCHDSGLQGAPVVGKAADWEDRSQLWQALLMEHAKAGYLDMPAKGGSEELSDLSVSYAVEYMMLETFPDQLPD